MNILDIEKQHTVQRLTLKEPLICGPGALKECIRRYGLNQKADRMDEMMGGPQMKSPEFTEPVKDVWLRLLMNDIDHDKGPYADKNGALAAFSDEILGDIGSEGPMGVLARVMDRVRPVEGTPYELQLPRKHYFVKAQPFLDPFRMVNDNLPTAGEILSKEKRSYGDERHAIVHPMEPYLLAVAVLRQRGFTAYPGRAYMGEGEEDPYSPLIAVMELEGAPLTTFRLIPAHPDIVHIDLMSDTAMMGALHAMRAISRANHLAVENVFQTLEHRAMPMEEIGLQLSRIADDLFGYCKRWSEEGREKDMLLFQSLHAIGQHIMQAEAWSILRRISSSLPSGEYVPDVFLLNRGINREAPRMPMNPEHLGMLCDMNGDALRHYPSLAPIIRQGWVNAAETADRAFKIVKGMLEEKLEKAALEAGKPIPS